MTKEKQKVEFEYKLEPTHMDEGGRLSIIAKNAYSKLVWLNHKNFGSDKLEHLDDLMDGETREYVIHEPVDNSRNRNYRAYRRICELADEWAVPYRDRFLKTFGRLPPEMELIDFDPFHGLKHTHYAESIKWTGTTFIVTMYVRAQDWCGQMSHIRATQQAKECVVSRFASHIPTPEFIELGNGTFRRNPEWPNKDLGYKPKLEAKWVLEPMFMRLLETATPGQRKAVERHCEANSFLGRPPLFDNCHADVEDGLMVDYNEDIIPWEEFRKL
jgi:hypothetical protein